MTLTSVQQSAYDNIQSRLSDNWYSGVNEDDLNSVRDTLYNLGATDTDAVIDAMADSGLLDKLAQESNQAEFLGGGQDGFSTEERQAFFADMARNLDGDSLVKVSNAFAGAEKGEDDLRVVTELADAVSRESSSWVKLDYIRGLSGSTGGSGISDVVTSGYSAATLTRHVDSEAAAIGTVLGSMEGSYLEAGFAALSDDALADVLETGVDEFSSNAGTGGGSTFDSARFEGVVRAAATLPDTPEGMAAKARVFDAAGDRLGAVLDAGEGLGFYAENEDAIRGMSEAMTALIDDDTSGLMRYMTYQDTTADGSAMTHYAEAMLASGQREGLADLMVDLQFGNAHNENAVERLDQVFTGSNGQQYRENAGALGYFVGAVYAGAQDRSDSIDAQREEIAGVLDFVAGKIPVAGGFSVGDAALGQNYIERAVEGALANDGLQPAQMLEQAALPRDASGRLAAGDDVTNAFGTTLDAVRRAQE